MPRLLLHSEWGEKKPVCLEYLEGVIIPIFARHSPAKMLVFARCCGRQCDAESEKGGPGIEGTPRGERPDGSNNHSSLCCEERR